MELISLIFLLVTLRTSLTSLPASSSAAAADSVGFRADLAHVDAARGYSRSELLRRAAQRGKLRAAKLAGPVAVHPSQGEYLLDMAIGTPPLHFTGILDTGSDLIWTQCKTCMQCIPQPSPLFDPFSSPSFSALPCAHNLCRALALDGRSACAPNCLYHYNYGDGTDSIGIMGAETFTFGSAKEVRVRHVGFGCGLFNGGDLQNSSGVVGFGRGPLSLVSQLGVTAFSYCFTDNFKDEPVRSPLFFGDAARLVGRNVRTTPLIRPDASARSPYYYLSLNGITVGNRLLWMPEAFRIKEDGSGGVITDSGTAFLQLDTPVYKAFVEAFRSQVKMRPVNGSMLDLCYRVSSPPARVPRLVFHFQDADWEMPRGNYMLEDGEGLECLVAQESPGLSILGNVQTENTHVLYDLRNDKLSFMPATCALL